MTGPRQRALRVVEDRPSLAAAIRDRRYRLSLTQADVGKILGVRQQTVGAWERGERPQSRFLDALARFLELSSETDVRRLMNGLPVTAQPEREVAQPVRGAVQLGADRQSAVDRLVEAFSERVRQGPLSSEEAALFRSMMDLIRS